MTSKHRKKKKKNADKKSENSTVFFQPLIDSIAKSLLSTSGTGRQGPLKQCLSNDTAGSPDNPKNA